MSSSSDGAAVTLVARRRERLDELASAVSGDGGAALVLQADLTDQEQAVAAAERTVSELGRLDTLVNNAGVMLLGAALESPTEESDRMLAADLSGCVVARLFQPLAVSAGSCCSTSSPSIMIWISSLTTSRPSRTMLNFRPKSFLLILLVAP